MHDERGPSQQEYYGLMASGETRPDKKTASSSIPCRSHDTAKNAKQSDPFEFGQRYLGSDDDPFEYNAWDHVIPDSEHESYCEAQYALQRASPVSDFDKSRFNDNPEKWWNLFYKQKQNTFFKDRNWLQQEFPVLTEITRRNAGQKSILEVGAGAGNTAFPILRNNENEELMIYAYDFSKTAVQTIRDSDAYNESYIHAEAWDVATNDNDGLPPRVDKESVDVVIMIFIFSALNPEQWDRALRNIHQILKPGGQVLFRDYGRGDLAQVRFKGGRWMGDNFYVRGDGTRVYFFEKDELRKIWRKPILSSVELHAEYTVDAEPNAQRHGFEIAKLDVDRRMIVNRSKRIKMYRCWIQGRFIKPTSGSLFSNVDHNPDVRADD